MDGETYDFWDYYINTDDSKLLYEGIKELYDKNKSSGMVHGITDNALEVLVSFMKWMDSQSSETLAKENDEYYLKIAELTLNAGEIYIRDRSQDSESDGSKDYIYREGYATALDSYGPTPINWDASNAKEMEKERIDLLVTGIEKQKKKINSVKNLKNSNSKINDSYDKKVKYSPTEVVNYLQENGANLNVNDTNKENNLAMAWVNGVSLNDNTTKKLNYNKTQIKAYYKIADTSHYLNNESDAVIREWDYVIENNKHINNNLREQYNKTKLTPKDRSNMITKIKNYCNGDWDKNELSSANQTLNEISNGNISDEFKRTTGISLEQVKEDTNLYKDVDYSEQAIYNHPKVQSGNDDNMNFDQTIKNSEKFLENADDNPVSQGDIKDFFNPLYNITLIIGIIVAVLVGAILGIKFLTGSVEQKADTKKLLIPYLAGCVAVFGAFGIWKLVVTILADL